MIPKERNHPLRILHITGLDLNSGAARGVYWLHKALISQGVDSRILITEYNDQDPSIKPLIKNSFDKKKWELNLKIEELPKKIYLRRNRTVAFSTGITGFSITKNKWYDWADIIHLHWINGSTVSLAEISRIKKPLIWTMRDMWPMTGGCHYSLDCKKDSSGCGACPILGSKTLEISSWIIKRKNQLLPKNIYCVTISSWLQECASNSTVLKGHELFTIPNCIDTDIFYPIDKNCTDCISIPETRIILSKFRNDPWKKDGIFSRKVSHCYQIIIVLLPW